MAYLLSNICTKNYWNWTITVKITVDGWMVYFFETQCTFHCTIKLEIRSMERGICPIAPLALRLTLYSLTGSRV